MRKTRDERRRRMEESLKQKSVLTKSKSPLVTKTKVITNGKTKHTTRVEVTSKTEAKVRSITGGPNHYRKSEISEDEFIGKKTA